MDKKRAPNIHDLIFQTAYKTEMSPNPKEIDKWKFP